MNTWGSFGIVHLSHLAASILIIIGLYYLLKNVKKETARLVLFVLSLSGMGAILYNLLTWGSPIEYLPLHLCSINAILLPIAIATKSRVLGNLLLIWCLGALFANLMTFYPTQFSDLYGWTHLFFFLPHTLELGIPLLLVKLKLVEKKPKYILSSLGITALIYTGVHVANKLLNAYCIRQNLTDWKGELIQVNYMYSIHPENPLLDLFYRIIPHEYWYMYLVFPILAVYLCIVYAKELLALLRKKKSA